MRPPSSIVALVLLASGAASAAVTADLGRAIADVVSDWDARPFGHDKFDTRQRYCHLLAVGLDADLTAELQSRLELQVIVLEGLDGEPEEREAVRKVLDESAWCVYALAKGVNRGNLVRLRRVVEVVHHRRNVFLTSSMSETYRVPTKQVDCQSLILQLDRRKDVYWIHSVCFNCYFSMIARKNLWIRDRGLVLKNTDYFARCCFGRTELYGKTFNVSVYGAMPYVALDYSRNPPLFGTDIDILVMLAKKFLFRPKMVAEKTWGVVMNGSWIGSVGSVSRKSSMLGIGHIGISTDKHQVVDFTVPNYLVEYSYFANIPQRLPPFKNIVAPFTNLVWAVYAASVLVAAGSFAITYFFYHENQDTFPFPIEKLQSSFDFLLLPLGMAVTQDRVGWYRDHPRYTAGSILVLLWSVSSTILALAYMSTLRASLIAVEYNNPPETIQGIWDSGEPIYHVANSSTIQNLKSSPTRVVRDIAWKVDNDDSYYKYTGTAPPFKEFDEMVETKTGYLIATRDAYKLERQRLLDRYGYMSFRFVKENIFTRHAAIVVPKHSLFVDHLNNALTGMIEFGIIGHFFIKGIPIRFLADGIKLSSPPTALGMEAVLTSLMFLGAMCSVAVFTFCSEMGRKKKRPTFDKKPMMYQEKKIFLEVAGTTNN